MKRTIHVLIGGVLVLMGFVAIFFVGRSSTLVCERIELNRINCQLAKEFLGIGLKQEKIRQLQSAKVEISEGSVSGGPGGGIGEDNYRVMLVGNSGNIPLTDYYSSGRIGKQTTASLINAFIANRSQPRLELRETGVFGFVIGGFFVVAGFIVICLGRSS